MTSPAADIFRRAADLNRHDPRREGNVVSLGADCLVRVVGDIHGNRAALARVIAATDLARHPDRRLVLQEIVHGPPDPRSGHDRSVEPLLRAARLKLEHPEQVLFLLGNHDIAQVTGNEITKEGGACKHFAEGVSYAYGPEAPGVLEAVCEFLLSPPLAIRCPNRVLLCHSLPDPGHPVAAAEKVFLDPYTDPDLRRGGGVYEWTWGRKQTEPQVDALAEELGVDFFLLGHRHVETGWEWVSPRALSIASDQRNGVIFEFRTDQPIDRDAIESYLKPIVALHP